MLAFLVPNPFDSAAHIFEIKWDGVRTVACLERDGSCRLFSRRLHDVTGLYPELARIAGALDPKVLPAVIDGEIVCLRDGKPSFEALQHRFTARDSRTIAEGQKRFPVVYIAFDLLVATGDDIMRQTLARRRQLLAEALALGKDGADTAERRLVHSDFVAKEGRAFAEAVFAQGLEGVMAKELTSPYEPGKRSRAWLKVKRPVTQRFLIGAANFHRDGRLASLEVGRLSEKGDLIPAGAVGSGISQAEARQLMHVLLPLQQADSPFAGPLPSSTNVFRRGKESGGELVRLWVRPRVSCLVAYLEKTESGALRHSVYKGNLRKES